MNVFAELSPWSLKVTTAVTRAVLLWIRPATIFENITLYPHKWIGEEGSEDHEPLYGEAVTNVLQLL